MADALFDVQERIVAVTGGLGQLGRQFVLALRERGARVAVLDNQVTAEQVAERFGVSAHDEGLLFQPCDVTDKSSIEAALERIMETWGAPFGLINNAALDSPPQAPAQENGPFETYPEASWDNVMEVNVKGVFQCCQVFGREMAKAQSGSIINIASIYGMLSPNQNIYEYRRQRGETFYKPVAYSVSKSALYNLTRYLATYWAPRMVRVNTLTFGGVFNDQDEQFLKAYCERVPLGRMADEEEYTGAVIFLLSQASSYMTGANMIIDGGWSAW